MLRIPQVCRQSQVRKFSFGGLVVRHHSHGLQQGLICLWSLLLLQLIKSQAVVCLPGIGILLQGLAIVQLRLGEFTVGEKGIALTEKATRSRNCTQLLYTPYNRYLPLSIW
jgi:hypothetical protein